MPINSLTVNIISAIVLTVMMGGGFWVWKSSIEEAALARVRVEQLQEKLKEQQKTIDDLTALSKESNEIISDLKDKTSSLNDKLKSLDVYLDTHKDDKESSEVLKRTFKELSQ